MFEQKTIQKGLNLAATLALGLALSQGANAADVAKGEQKAKEVCAACHGKDGKTPINAEYPILAGQYEDFLLRALKDYKSGSRANPIMGAQAKGLSKSDMEDLAAYFASLPSGLNQAK